MLESKQEFVAIDTNISGSTTKRSPFHLLSSIFGKKKANSLDNDPTERFCPSNEYQSCSSGDVYKKLQLEADYLYEPKRCSTTPGTLEDLSCGRLDPSFLSPSIHAKKKNLKIDLENLHLSRQDNPYLKQLEKLPDETFLTCSDSLAERALLESEWHLETENEVDIHQHLVRSPPPQFPQNISHFMYSQVNSPKKISNHANVETSDEQENFKKPLNPIQAKKETAILDPSIREVLEYQKAQLIAGLQQSLTTSQGVCGRQGSRWTQDSGSRNPHAASSLPGLTSCSFEVEQRRTSLGPIKIGRAYSDSICHDNKIRKIG